MEKIKKDYKRKLIQLYQTKSYWILYPIMQKKYKQKDNEVLFLSDSREDFSGNFEFVKKEIEKRKKYHITGIFSKNFKEKKNNTFKQRINLLKKMCIAKYIFVDDFYPNIYTIKFIKQKKIIQLWHAMGAFKTVGYARLGKPGGPRGLNYTHRNYTGCIVSGDGIVKDYAKAFGISVDKVHSLGIPRTDIFFDKEYKENIIKKLYKEYPILKDKKVILFAPTFRGNGKEHAYYDYSWVDFKKLKEEFKDEYVCIIKMHPFIHNEPDYDFENDDFYLDLTKNREVNDLLFVTDLLITDYSSIIFEYSFFKKPVIFYTPDFDDYINSRSFFYDFEKYNYGVRANDFEHLLKAIRKSKVDNKKLDKFYNYFCGACDGNSTKKVVDFFLDEK